MTGSISTSGEGEVLGVVGGSGSGKSVLLRTIVGLNRPAAAVSKSWTETRGLSDADGESSRIALGRLFQSGALFSSLTLANNVHRAAEGAYRLPPEAGGRSWRP